MSDIYVAGYSRRYYPVACLIFLSHFNKIQIVSADFHKSRQHQNSTEIRPVKAALLHADTHQQKNGQNKAFRYNSNAFNYSELYVKVQFVPHTKHGMLPLENQSINNEQGNNGCLKITRNKKYMVCEEYRAFKHSTWRYIY